MDSKYRDHEIDAKGRSIRKGRVGVIVLGWLITGLVVALVLVIGTFGGAQEHVIMGTALLGWALGWALLAMLSTRWSNQAHRWAIVPAALMAVAGACLLIFTPDANAMNLLGWIWPLALIALAVWMTVQARRTLRSITRRLILYPLCVGLVVAGVGGGYETIQEQVDRSTTAMPGHLVDVGGRRLYLHCTGSGSPTVVLVSGLAETSVYWGGWIAPAVAQNTTVCAYDRAGQGWSDPPASPQDGVAVATDLHTLLDHAQIPGPYLLGDRPLVVVTAAKGTQTGWLPLQDKMTGLSTNSVHRVLPDTDHPGLIHDRAGATQASQAILDVVASVRSGMPLTES